MPPNISQPPGGVAAGTLLNILSALQSIAQSLIAGVTELTKRTPNQTSGQLSADTLVFTGFVRVSGISVVAAGSPVGTLNDAGTIATSAAGNVIFEIPGTVGYYPVDLIFANGCVYKVGTSEKVAIFFGRN